MSFAADLQRFAAKAEANSDQVVRKVALDLTKRVVTRTPVDTGRAKGSWTPGIYTLPKGLPETLDKIGGATISRAASSIARLKAGTDFYLVSNLAYMFVLEYGRDDGTPGSRQAPQGMVRVSVQDFQNHVEQAAREVNR